MDESRAVLARLERIESLDRRGADPRELVDELRALLTDAEAWSRREGGERGARAVDELRRALDLDTHEACERTPRALEPTPEAGGFAAAGE